MNSVNNNKRSVFAALQTLNKDTRSWLRINQTELGQISIDC